MTGSCSRCWPRPGCGSVRRLACGTATSSAAGREIRIVPRADNANGARAKLREAAVIPVSTPLVRLYSEYMHAEYGDLDSDYVFVNLCGGRIGAPLTLSDGAQARRPYLRAHRDRVHGAHAASHARHRADPPGVPIEVVARLLTHRSSTTTSQTYVHLDAADVREALVRAGVWDQAGSAAMSASLALPPPGRARYWFDGEAARPGRRVRRRPLERAASRRSRPARAAGGPVRRHHPGLAARPGEAVVPVPAGHRVRVHHHPAGALALSRFSAFLAERHPASPARPASPGRCWRITCPGCSPRATRRPPGRCR